ncbi:MAG: immune inhibitor A [Clostridiales bacterium]|nr:immune inhibitor A [Clostridiales bacterium]
MSKKHILLVAALVALLTLTSFSMAWAAQPKGLADMPDPIDPQTWKLQEDMLWSELKRNPVIDWTTELNPAGLANPMGRGAAPIKGALVLVDFWDRPFIATRELNTDLLGYYLYDEFGKFEDHITKNPVIHVDAEDYREWIRDYLNKNQEINHYRSIDEFWRENSYGKWAVDLDSFGPYHLPGFEFEFDLSYTSWSDLPPIFRRATSGSSNYRNMMNEGIDCALQDGVYLGDYDFFFILHSGYDESSVWLEFGQMQWARPEDVPYEYGPGAKMEEVEEMLTANPEYLLELETTMTSFSSTTPVINGYVQSFLRDKIAEIKTRKAAGTLDGYEFKFPAADWAWQASYSYGNAGPTRYVPWASWIATVSRWSSSGSSTVPRSDGTSRSIRQSGQGESDGMGVFAHEFGHITGLSDNYESTMWTQNVSPKTEYWDLMSRGDRVGPGGYHSRWMVPAGREAGTCPAHYMIYSKQRGGYYDAGDLLQLTVAQLKARTPVVAEVAARNIPMNNAGLYPQLEEYGLIAPNFYKGIELTFDSANPDASTLVTSGYSNTRYRAGRTAIEVVDRTGYDSFCADHGVLLSRIQSGSTDTHRWVIDSHLYNINLIDYYLNGVPTYYCIGHSDQLDDALFHAGKSFVDSGYYKGDYTVNNNGTYGGSGTKHGSARQWEERNGRDIISGDTVNEWYDAANKLHFYILAKHENPGKYGEFLSYQVGMLHDDGPAVGGELIVSAGKQESADPGRVATQWFKVTNTGAATDIIRAEADCGFEFTLLNDLYAIEAGQTIEIPVYFRIPPGDFDSKSVTLTVSSESNPAKTGAFSSTAFAANINAPAQIYLREGNRIDYVVSVVNIADEGANLFTIDAAFDAQNLIYTGYTFGPSVLAYNPTQGPFSYDVAGGYLTLDMYLARPGVLLKAESETPLVTFHFTVKDGVPAGPDQTVVDSLLSNVRAYCFISGKSSPVDAIVTKPGAATKILLHPLGYEGGELDEATISWLIYHHLYKTGAAADWNEIKKYDLNGNGMIDLADIVALWSLIGK